MISWQTLEEMIDKAYRSNTFLRENKEYFISASLELFNKEFKQNEQKCSSCQNNLFRRFKNQIEIEKKKPIVEEIIETTEEEIIEVKETKPKKTKKKDGIS